MNILFAIIKGLIICFIVLLLMTLLIMGASSHLIPASTYTGIFFSLAVCIAALFLVSYLQGKRRTKGK